nr:acyltransferase [Novosphingobium profundi]
MIAPRTALALKGIAILLMLAHHLFALPTLIRAPNHYVPLVPGLPLEYELARLGKICVPIFLFLSGYGLARRHGEADAVACSGRSRSIWRQAWQRAGRFLATYAYYFTLAAALVLLVGAMLVPSDPQALALLHRLRAPALLTLGRPLVYEWWFAQTYLALVLLLPLALHLARRPALLLGLALLAFALGALLDAAHLNPPLFSLSNLLVWQLPFSFGLAFARHEAVDRDLSAWLAQRRVAVFAAGLALLGAAAMELLLPSALTPYLILAAPLFLVMLVHFAGSSPDRPWLAWLGRHSLPIWLVHPFLCTYFAQGWIYAPRLSLLVFASLLAQTALLVLAFEALRHAIWRAASRMAASLTGVLPGRQDRSVHPR